LLLALPASAQTSGGGSGGSTGGTGVGASPSGGGATTQPGTSSGADSSDTRGSSSGRAPIIQDNVANPSGPVSSPPAGSGRGTATRARGNCGGKAEDCTTPFQVRYMRLVDAMVRTACPRCIR
jgi:hypothetical protein